MRLTLPRRRAGVALAATLLAGGAAAATATCINRVTNQPAPCPGARPSPYGEAQAGIGSTLVLAGPASTPRFIPRICRNFFTGAARPCRGLNLPLPPPPPSLPEPAADAPAPPPGYGPPH